MTDVLHSLMIFFPADQSGRGPGMGMFLFQIAAFIAIIYFLIIRPKVQQEKQHREKISAIKRGDQVVTAGGIVAEVVHIKEDRITVRSGESKLIIQRDRIADVIEGKSSGESHK